MIYINHYKANFRFCLDGMFSDMSRRLVLGGVEKYNFPREGVLVLGAWAILFWFLFFVGIYFSQKQIFTIGICY